MSDFQTALLFYLPLQLASITLLPKWWRLAAIPALYAAPGIFFHDGYMGDIFAAMFMIYASAYLVVVWVFLGLVKFIRVLFRKGSCPDESLAK